MKIEPGKDFFGILGARTDSRRRTLRRCSYDVCYVNTIKIKNGGQVSAHTVRYARDWHSRRITPGRKCQLRSMSFATHSLRSGTVLISSRTARVPPSSAAGHSMDCLAVGSPAGLKPTAIPVSRAYSRIHRAPRTRLAKSHWCSFSGRGLDESAPPIMQRSWPGPRFAWSADRRCRELLSYAEPPPCLKAAISS